MMGGFAKPLRTDLSEPLRNDLMASPYPKFRNDNAVPEIRIGVREFNCIGVSPPHDHPHVYINMRDQDVILCPYCATRFRFDPQLGPFEADPPDSLFVDSSRRENGSLRR